jgi:hypothetical protein
MGRGSHLAICSALIVLLIACGRSSGLPSTDSRQAQEEPAPYGSLTPQMLISAPLPGRASTPYGPRCTRAWSELIELWDSEPVRRQLDRPSGVYGCRVVYRYFDPVGPHDRLEVAHTIALLRSAEAAGEFFESAPELVASGNVIRDDQQLAWRGGADALSVLRSRDSAALALRTGNVVHVVSFSPWPFAFDAEVAMQFARLIASRFREADRLDQRSVARVDVRVHVAQDTDFQFTPPEDAIDRALAEVQRIYGEALPMPELLVTGRQAEPDLTTEFEARRDIPRLIAGSADCVVELFYVGRSSFEGGWAWVPTTTVFMNARQLGERLMDPGHHGRILAHELGHLWGLDHSEDPSNLMDLYGRGTTLTAEQSEVVSAYLAQWAESCARL